MALLHEWNAFLPGIIFGCIGIVLGIVTIFVYRKLTHKSPIKISGKNLITIADCIIGTLLLGVGMCFCMVWNNLILGIIVGIIGIVLLLCLIPLVSEIKDND